MNQYCEIKNIQWFNEDECNNKIRDYDDHKLEIIKKFFEWKKKYKNFGKII